MSKKNSDTQYYYLVSIFFLNSDGEEQYCGLGHYIPADKRIEIAHSGLEATLFESKRVAERVVDEAYQFNGSDDYIYKIECCVVYNEKEVNDVT